MKWVEIAYTNVPANMFRYELEGVICRSLESGVSITFRVKTNKEHDALKVEYSTLGKEKMLSHIDEMKSSYDFKIESITDSSFVITDIQEKVLKVS